jgi:hypothetical protein
MFNRPEVIPEIQPNPLLSHYDVQVMINSALERQAKSIDELLCRLIEEWDVTSLIFTVAKSLYSTVHHLV